MATNAGSADASTIETPARIEMIKQLLTSMGVDDHDPKVTQMLLEFAYKYMTDVLKDATVYQEHAQKTDLDLDDVRLAIQTKLNGQFSQPPPREFMIDIAKAKNAIPLPIIRPGVHLPPAEYCNITPNSQVVVKTENGV
ncbi:hypothetical protein GUITHDRAFT_162218 [Guillardia theta CCMP2712]|uniref:Transcription initiation factor TFIID subunit 9 n=1 Tax=Guillardia theta (strain CCMP2712) TaxID=905079 RepID=L1JLH9_GUITC|nr:hypothetical protein GUITHDRAFT_162218 [Guillardia theta CCMP2712]EKX49019.1 hypothetical protein GUITHDRAFT_162218 [Guillardia theta CCMP2712]|mmetsp:Transcript_16558/g.55237  ORF Transcript_16558/g.55237 Transcript_16558/m.55237 type:complete len:139 (+) Transcript_16558:963-1379(+)|eukprot:XP_005835999.1 hypothetical protein GUITHDRAFT_162218 [Guillardia theta CCMP2712]